MSEEDRERDESERTLFINGPMRSAEHLMTSLYSDDAFYVHSTSAWVGADDAKKLFLYGVCKEVFKACIGLMSDEEVMQKVPDGEPDRMTRLITGAVTDVQTYRRRKLLELLVLLVLFDRKHSRDEEYRIFLSAENLDLRLGEQQDFRDLHKGGNISILNIQHSIDDFLERIEGDLQALGVTDIWFLDGAKLKKPIPSVFNGKKALYLQALKVATPEERLALGVSYGEGYSRTSQAVHPMVGSHDHGENRPKQINSNIVFLSIVAMHVMHLAHRLAGIEDPHGLATIMGPDFERSEAATALAALTKDFRIGDVVLTAWHDLAEIVDAHTGDFGDTAYRIRFLTQPPLPAHPEDWTPSRWITARLVGPDTVRSIFETPLNSGRIREKFTEIGREILAGPDSELLERAKRSLVRLHKEGALIPMLLQFGILRKNETLD
jgi:hypothetical protein